ncbi:monocarboxylate transporter 11-like, partial [Camarhynchus parvulus]|uniref:monocarboxylate transporter 11-like n=1 Tax=Geospiza parvula TaxID=87175 RepID=UPI00123837D6
PPGALPALSAAFLQVALVSGSVRALGLCLPPLGGAFGAGARAQAWVGSCPLAALQLGGPLAAALSARFGPRGVAMAGGALAGAGLFLGAFATRLEHLYLSLGGLTGLGWSLSFTPALATVPGLVPVLHAASGARPRWFPARGPRHLRRPPVPPLGPGLAPLLPPALDSYGWRGAPPPPAAVSLHLVARAASSALLPRTPPEPPEPSGTLRRLRAAGLPALRRRPALLDLGYYVPFDTAAPAALELGCDGRRAAARGSRHGRAGRAPGACARVGWRSGRAAALRQLAAWAALAGAGGPGDAAGDEVFGRCWRWRRRTGLRGGPCAPLQFAGVAQVVGARGAAMAIGVMQMVESAGSLLGAPLAGWLRDVTGDFTVSFLAAGAFLLASSLLILTLPPAPPEPPPSPPEPL